MHARRQDRRSPRRTLHGPGAWAAVRGHRRCLPWVLWFTITASPAVAGPLEQRIGERLQAHCATLADAAARRECLADLLAFRERYGLRHAARRRPGDAEPALSPSAGSEIGGATAQLPTQPPDAPALGSTGTPSGTAGALPPVTPIQPLRVVQRRQVGYALYVYRLSDGSVWEDVEAHARGCARAPSLASRVHASALHATW